MFDFIVIGKGLIGSAAARYLSMRGRTAVIGRLGAELLADGRWSADLAEELFRPVFEA